MSRQLEVSEAGGFFARSENTRRRALRYSWVPEHQAAELGYEHDWDAIADGEVDGETLTNRQAALVDVFADLLAGLGTTERLCVQTFLDQRWPLDRNWRDAAKLIGTNPETGRPIDEKTVKRKVVSALGKLQSGLAGLPDWQQVLLGLPAPDEPAPAPVDQPLELAA